MCLSGHCIQTSPGPGYVDGGLFDDCYGRGDVVITITGFKGKRTLGNFCREPYKYPKAVL
jgi:hypothetical protein